MGRLARASAIQFGVQGIQTVIGFTATLYFANVLGATVLGKYYLALALVNWLLIPFAGVRSATMKRMSEGDNPTAYLSTGTAVQLAFVCIEVAALLVFANIVDAYVGAVVAGLVALLLVSKAFSTFLLAALRGTGRVQSASLVEGGGNVLRVGVQLVFVLGGMTVAGLIWGEIIAAIVTVGSLVVLLRSFGRPEKKHLVSIYEYGKFAWLSSVKAMSYSWLDTIVLGFFVLPEIVGSYEVAWRISAAFILLPTAIVKVLFQDISRSESFSDLERISETLRRALSIAGFLSIPGVVGAIVLGEPILQLYGDEFVGGFVPLVILSIGRILQSYETVLLQSLNALDLPEITFRISALFFVTNILANVVFVWTTGAVGAAVATSGSIGLATLLSFRALRRHIAVRIEWETVASQFVAALVMGIIVELALRWVNRSGLVTVLGLVCLGVVVYVCLVLGLSSATRRQLFRITRS